MNGPRRRRIFALLVSSSLGALAALGCREQEGAFTWCYAVKATDACDSRTAALARGLADKSPDGLYYETARGNCGGRTLSIDDGPVREPVTGPHLNDGGSAPGPCCYLVTWRETAELNCD